MTTSGTLFTKEKSLAVLALVALGATSFDSEFGRVVRNPAKYHDKRVHIVAIADVMGDHFALYQSPPAKTANDLKRQIFVALRYDPRVASYDQYDGHLVQITGVIDATRHGPFGGYACEIVADRIEFARRGEKEEGVRAKY